MLTTEDANDLDLVRPLFFLVLLLTSLRDQTGERDAMVSRSNLANLPLKPITSNVKTRRDSMRWLQSKNGSLLYGSVLFVIARSITFRM